MLTSHEKARFAWHCRRGMLELDLILQAFLAKGLDKLSAEQIKRFEMLLSCTDPELYAWLMGHLAPEDPELSEIVSLIRNDN